SREGSSDPTGSDHAASSLAHSFGDQREHLHSCYRDPVWSLANRTPYAAERNSTRDQDGAHWWLVAVRATFTIGPNAKLTLADEQLPPVLAPEHHGEAGKSSLRYDSDLLARKPSTDLLVLGTAHAPHGKPAATVPVVLRLGSLEKTLLVHGERVYYDGLAGLATTAPRHSPPARSSTSSPSAAATPPTPILPATASTSATRSAVAARAAAPTSSTPRPTPSSTPPEILPPPARRASARSSPGGSHAACWPAPTT